MSQHVNEPVRVGIAGLGRSGWGMHANTLNALNSKYKVAAVADPLEERLQEAKDRFGCQTYMAVSDMVKDDTVELVVVAMPSHLHADIAIEAMRAGKHVIVEKPFADNLDGSDRMIAVAKETGQLLTGSQDLRFEADFLKIREVIESGKLGRIIQIRIAWHWFRRRWDWQTLKQFGGGSLNNDGSHVVDQALLLFGDAEPEVFCHMERTPLTFGDAEDHVKIILRAPGAPLIDMEFSNAVAYPQDKWLIMGTLGGLKGSDGSYRWKYIDPDLLPAREVSDRPTADRSYNREELPWAEESCTFTNEGWLSKNERLYNSLYATLREDAPLAVTPTSIRRQLAVLERCRELSPNWVG